MLFRSQDQEEEKTVSMEHDFMYWMRICYNPFLEKDGNFAWVELNNWIDEITKMGKEHLKRFLAFCLDASRDCLLKNVGAGQISRFDDEFIPGLTRFSPFIKSENIEELAELYDRAYYAVERNANLKILMLDLTFSVNVLLRRPSRNA